MIFHDHCKECGKVIPLFQDYCSLDCEYAEYNRNIEKAFKKVKDKKLNKKNIKK